MVFPFQKCKAALLMLLHSTEMVEPVSHHRLHLVFFEYQFELGKWTHVNYVQSRLNCFFAMRSLERLSLVYMMENSNLFCIAGRPRGLLDAPAAVLLEFYLGLCLSWILIWRRVRKIMIQFLLLLFIQLLLLLFPNIKPELFYWDGIGWFSTTDLDTSKHLRFL